MFILTGQTQCSRPWILIPARGGSKGIPYKNVRPLGGKPLILHVLESCLQIAEPSRVVVSTDDEIIASAVTFCPTITAFGIASRSKFAPIVMALVFRTRADAPINTMYKLGYRV